MSKTLVLTYGIGLQGSATNDAVTVGTAQESLSIQPTATLSTGTGSNQGNVMFSAPLTFTGTQDLDLTGLVTSLGSTNLSKVKIVWIKNLDASHDLSVTSSVTNGWDAAIGTETVHAGGQIYKDHPLSGWTVDGTHKILRLDAGANTISVKVVIIGIGT